MQNKIEEGMDIEGAHPYVRFKAIKNTPRKYSLAIVK